MSFERTVLPLALEKGMGVIAMKTTGVGQLMTQNVAPLTDCLNYVWSLPIATAILGCTTPQQVEADVKLAAAHTSPLTQSRMDELRAKHAAVDFAKLEPWKVDQSATQARLPSYQGD
jgi:aryl-alcohol dehydrogenase-like predicted oxidoreductase